MRCDGRRPWRQPGWGSTHLNILRKAVSLRVLLPATLAGLIAVVPALVVSHLIASESATRLVARQGDLVLDGVETEVRSQLEPIEAHLALARQVVAQGRVDVRDADALRSFVLGLPGATWRSLTPAARQPATAAVWPCSISRR